MHKYKILCITPIKHIPNIEDALRKLGDLTIIDDPLPEDLKLIDNDFDIIFTNPNKSKIYIGPELLNHGSLLSLSVLLQQEQFTSTKTLLKKGYSANITHKRIQVLKTISSTAELAFTLMMSSLRNLIPAYHSIKKEEWNYEPFIGRQLNNKICVFGYGRLGTMFVKFCHAFGADVKVNDP